MLVLLDFQNYIGNTSLEFIAFIFYAAKSAFHFCIYFIVFYNDLSTIDVEARGTGIKSLQCIKELNQNMPIFCSLSCPWSFLLSIVFFLMEFKERCSVASLQLHRWCQPIITHLMLLAFILINYLEAYT